ncbi:Aste57867_22829 [Aphanomyces stellatus]|uniref:Aste57867_22829 protein n=1 Tax=Aphanomyces stellatus TaxID=120398 RepID=A0A485LQU5_9STRA|nr:hypothetical protein As57867_022758 [Aphanomyces stellatus]VFT99480.1 Aste57867_22829 [Aphanomyces stellatus]
MKTSITSVSKPAVAGVHMPTQYVIRVADQRSDSTQWLVHKRYSDFRTFRAELLDPATDLCGACGDLPDEAPIAHKFPGRKWIFSNNKSVIEERKEGLALFLDRVNISVRNCVSSSCACRPLLEKFLMLPDMRYTFIDMSLDDPASPPIQTKRPALAFIPPPPSSSLRRTFAAPSSADMFSNDVPELLRHTFHGTSSRTRRHSVHISSAERIKKLQELAVSPPKHEKKQRMSLETIEETD